MSEVILQVSNISKSFSGVKALDNVQLTVKKGEVHALMGENGAGKSTCMKILVGLLKADAGEIILDGQLIRTEQEQKILQKGISMIHQELLIVPELTVAQNMFLGREKEISGSGWLNDNQLTAEAVVILEELGIAIPADVKMKHLSVAQKQMIEIAKAVSNNAKVIIMDEPTSAITDNEVGILFKIIKDLTERGVGVIYISHKMDEIFKIADSITIFRDGKYITTRATSDLDKNELIALMVGREIQDMFPSSPSQKGEVMLSVRGLGRRGEFENISFEVCAGEVLGIAGLMGAGRTEIARVIFGLDRPTDGEIYLNGEKMHIKSPGDAIANGIGYVSEDRKDLGFIPEMSIGHNISLGNLSAYASGIFIKSEAENRVSKRIADDLRIKASGLNQKVKNLSGGNQQKVVIGKVLLVNPRLIILDEPTRGIDVGAKFEIYKLIHELAHQGIAVIMISSELPEILGMSDRILVLSKGRQRAILDRREASQELIMKHAVH